MYNPSVLCNKLNNVYNNLSKCYSISWMGRISVDDKNYNGSHVVS